MRSGDALAVLLVLWLVGRARGAAEELRRAVEPSLPEGSRTPEMGELREVPMVRTSLDPAGLPQLMATAMAIVDTWEHSIADALREYLSLQVSVPASPNSEHEAAGKLLAAQVCAETGDGRKVWHYNVGNIHVSKGDYWTHRSTPGERFGVYLSPLQGAVAMVARIRRLWPRAWHVLRATPGLPRAYADALVTGGRRYYTADPAEYARNVRSALRRHGWQ